MSVVAMIWAFVRSPAGKAICATLAIVACVAAIHRAGEKAGAAKVERADAKAHTVAVAEARGDERAAATGAAQIAADTAQRVDAATAATQSSIGNLHHAIDAVPPAAPGAPLPAAPVDRLRDELNARIAAAGRAADAADALP